MADMSQLKEKGLIKMNKKKYFFFYSFFFKFQIKKTQSKCFWLATKKYFTFCIRFIYYKIINLNPQIPDFQEDVGNFYHFEVDMV